MESGPGGMRIGKLPQALAGTLPIIYTEAGRVPLQVIGQTPGEREMKCPCCKAAITLTWRLYSKAPLRRFWCPHCHERVKFKNTVPYLSKMLLVSIMLVPLPTILVAESGASVWFMLFVWFSGGWFVVSIDRALSEKLELRAVHVRKPTGASET